MKHLKSNSRDRTNALTLPESQRLTKKEEGILANGLKRKLLDQVHSSDALNDNTFDLVFSPEVRNFSHIHWTPLAVATKAAELLKEMKVERLLDVGSGCGKFCLITSILSEIQVTGVEQREFLSLAAKKAKNAFRLNNVNFITGSAFDLSWKEFDCVYFFNPFCEQKTPERRMRNDVPMNESLYGTFLQSTLERLREQKKGSLVMTYYGLGATLPDEYSLHYQKALGSDFLKIWKKTS